MYRKLKYCLIVAILFGVHSLMAQSSKFKREHKKIFNEAESYYYYGDFKSAIDLYKQIDELDPQFAELQFKLGDSYYQLKKYEEAIDYLKIGMDFNKDAIFYLAFIELYFGNLDEAESYLKSFEIDRDLKYTQIENEQIKLLEKNIVTARELINSPEIVNIINLGDRINTENAEYVPIISSDESFLVFTSRRLREDNLMDPTGKPFEDIYTSKKSTDSKGWTKAEPIKGEINTDMHDACVGLSPDGNRLFVYRSNENLIGGDLYESVFINDKWTVPVRMSEKINNAYSIEPSASLSLDGRTLYFSSNREGGYGGFDIYRVILLPNGDWSLPKNLGPTINTKFDDDAPFIHPDGKTLYFSSKGHVNMGGFDVFKSVLNDTEWGEPINMGYPTNTTKDDIYFTISANEQHGYYASDKKGGFGKHDIYLIDYLEKSLRQSVVKGVITDATNNSFVSADITILDLETSELSGVHVTDIEDGDFIFLVNPNVEYEILIEANGFDSKTEVMSFSIDQLRNSQQVAFQLKTSTASE